MALRTPRDCDLAVALQLAHAPVKLVAVPRGPAATGRVWMPDGAGGVGARRQCKSSTGTIEQTILEWDEPRQLVFQMVDTDLHIKRFVSSIIDEFTLSPQSDGATRVTRTTTVEIIGRLRTIRAISVWIGLKRIHRFVFANWERSL